ncbi:LacI family transcriptional regulator [Thiospirochaeta perfilievii]|uniref:LacI family transcriptional regulator n=1 Tax=Thiospirochaeta perfilievii TaxID=252967 RepID=A0A5C1QG13_9SPIO|nr:LacI family DNA-binding transcriptional regulator [Thiospirochaeta perfilievii]QEN05476.1 LacI family transcriptional regulator [Thiospirochaeta perfilievii]
MKKATIQDVAKRSGVSITTVSRVINKNYPVKESTRIKVEKAIEYLNFKPNLLAKGLIQNYTKTIGILTPSIENLFFSEVIKGIDSVIRPLGYTTFLCHTEGCDKSEIEMLNSLIDRQVDGIIMIDPRKENILSGKLEKISSTTPLVLINGYSDGIKCNYVINDAVSGVNEALNYLFNNNCRDIALLRGGKSYSYDIKEVVYNNFISDKNLNKRVLKIDDGNDLNAVNSSKQLVLEALKSNNKPRAILCCNDWMAIGALNAAKDAGVPVPDKLRIIGFDNTIISQISSPALSTVDQQMTKLGQLAAQRIYRIMSNEDNENQKIYLETKLVLRES